ncbi:MAG: ATP-binding cassette domain-containing protein [Chlamydiales bacterium]
MANQKGLYIICGPNGAGKTTLIRTFSKHLTEKKEVEIAPNPDDPTSSAGSLEKQKLMLSFVKECLNNNRSVIFETTGSGHNSVINLMHTGSSKGFRIIFWYLYLPDVQISKERIRERCIEGGHFVPDLEVENRYCRGLENLHLFFGAADSFVVIDRSRGTSGRLIASKNTKHGILTVNNHEIWTDICSKNKNLSQHFTKKSSK